MTKQQARLLSFLSCLFIELGWYVIELGWHVIMHVILIKQLRFLYFMICDFFFQEFVMLRTTLY